MRQGGAGGRAGEGRGAAGQFVTSGPPAGSGPAPLRAAPSASTRRKRRRRQPASLPLRRHRACAQLRPAPPRRAAQRRHPPPLPAPSLSLRMRARDKAGKEAGWGSGGGGSGVPSSARHLASRAGSGRGCACAVEAVGGAPPLPPGKEHARTSAARERKGGGFPSHSPGEVLLGRGRVPDVGTAHACAVAGRWGGPGWGEAPRDHTSAET